MPLARTAMYKKGIELYIAPTADSRDGWISTMIHIALEGRCFVLGCNQFFTKSMYPKEYQHLLKDEKDMMCRGGSVIVSPMGKIIRGPLFEEPGALIAELDLNQIISSKMDLDLNGHYTRPDIFEYNAKDQPNSIKD